MSYSVLVLPEDLSIFYFYESSKNWLAAYDTIGTNLKNLQD